MRQASARPPGFPRAFKCVVFHRETGACEPWPCTVSPRFPSEGQRQYCIVNAASNKFSRAGALFAGPATWLVLGRRSVQARPQRICNSRLGVRLSSTAMGSSAPGGRAGPLCAESGAETCFGRLRFKHLKRLVDHGFSRPPTNDRLPSHEDDS